MQDQVAMGGNKRLPEIVSTRPNYISSKDAVNLGGLFRQRVLNSANKVAYKYYDSVNETWKELTWSQMADSAARWQDAFQKEGLVAGDRVAVMMRNCCEWVMFDQAALALGLVTVPVYADDRAGNVAYILRDSGSRVLVIGGMDEWERIEPVSDEMEGVQRIVYVKPIEATVSDDRVVSLSEWLPEEGGKLLSSGASSDDLASIVYTSGTTGFPKGVMLSHGNMLSNAEASASCVELSESDIGLSFLPLSHTLERTVGYYLPIMVGATIAYSRSIPLLGEDLQLIRPSFLISVPRIYERVYAKVMAGLEEKGATAKKLFNLAVTVGWRRFLYSQGRASWSLSLLLWPLLDRLVAKKIPQRLGGCLRLAVSGGAPLASDVSRVFLGLGVPVLQGYGLTESSPVIACNTPENNVPESVGHALRGVDIRIGDNDELLARGPNIMLGYWNNQDASEKVLEADGWLHTGDKARIDEQGNIHITGRIKEIIVLSNGEKISPADMEMAITMDPLIEQAMVVGEQKPYLSAICILDPEKWQEFASSMGIDPDRPKVLELPEVENAVLARVAEQVKMFPGYARIVRVHLSLDPWSVENGLMTPTLKLKRAKVMERLAEPVANLYEGH